MYGRQHSGYKILSICMYVCMCVCMYEYGFNYVLKILSLCILLIYGRSFGGDSRQRER